MRFIALMCLVTLAACAKKHDDTLKLQLTATPGVDGSCVATIGGKSIDPRDEAALAAAVEPYAKSQAEVQIIGRGDVPYRCIGGVIYTMQRQGHTKVGFIAEPPASNASRQK